MGILVVYINHNLNSQEMKLTDMPDIHDDAAINKMLSNLIWLTH